jgi:hypothetical protein
MPEVRYWDDAGAREALVERGREVLARVREKLDGASGVVAIEPQSGDCFVGTTLGQANDAAYDKYPDRWLYFCRLDDPGAEIVLPTW